ncbi:MAG: BadF/BadG/BcrA/BcrD ATPase family protein [Gammaproteobacteria bacterium]
MQKFLIGVDGGASKCIVHIQDAAGHSIGHAVSGPANIRLSVTDSWQSIYTAIQAILQPLAISLDNPNYIFHAGMGLAGCELPDTYQAFITQPHFFKTLQVVSDAHTACLGAHAGKDGAIIIAGTGVVGYQIEQQRFTKVGGWGFPLDDAGGGAWLGLSATRLTLQWLDGRRAISGLAQTIYEYFDHNQERLVTWANQANSTAFAALAPLVIQQAAVGDAAAKHLMQQAATEIDSIATALTAQQLDTTTPLSCALIGGITPFLEPLLSKELQSRIRPCAFPPEIGAILMVRSKQDI